MIREAIRSLVRSNDLSELETASVMDEIMSGDATSAQIGSFITALRMKGETVDEIYACAKVMRDKSMRINVPEGAIDTCGTGGDNSGTFNISTTAAFIVAGAGVPVAKHGNRSVSSRSGSADLLESLGVNIEIGPVDVERCVREVGIGFLFAPTFHPAMKHAMGPRREIGVRTIFNMLGPLTNPANVKYQVLGVFDPRLIGTMARVLERFGVKGAMVINGSGLDELSTINVTNISEVNGNGVHEYTLTPEEFGLKRASMKDIVGGGPERNAEIAASVLDGEVSAYTDIVLLNAGAALYTSGKCNDIAGGIDLARKAIENGRARGALDSLKELTTVMGGVV